MRRFEPNAELVHTAMDVLGSFLGWRIRRRRSATAGALALGACAMGATAIGALAIGRLAIGALAVKRVRIGALTIDELEVRRLRVLEGEAAAVPGPS